MAMNKPWETACSNCSCKCGIKKCVYDESGNIRGEFWELYVEWKTTGKTFPCYMREEDRPCKIMWEALEWFDKQNILDPYV